MSENKSRLVLTGVTGPKSGGALIELLAADADWLRGAFPGGVRVLCRQSSDVSRVTTLLPEAEILRGSLTDPEFLNKALAGADTVVHVAGIRFSRLLVRAAAEAGVRRLILVHTTGIYSKYKCAGEEYRRIDAEVEELCGRAGILLTILRPTMIYGSLRDRNVVKFISLVDRFPLTPVIRGARYELQPVHYGDLARAYLDVLKNEAVTAGRNYDLSGGEVILLRDMLLRIGELLGKKVRFLSLPLWAARFGAWAIRALTLGKKDLREKVLRLCEPRAYPHDDAARDFGYSPRSFRQGVKDEVRAYTEQKNRAKNGK